MKLHKEKESNVGCIANYILGLYKCQLMYVTCIWRKRVCNRLGGGVGTLHHWLYKSQKNYSKTFPQTFAMFSPQKKAFWHLMNFENLTSISPTNQVIKKSKSVRYTTGCPQYISRFKYEQQLDVSWWLMTVERRLAYIRGDSSNFDLYPFLVI